MDITPLTPKGRPLINRYGNGGFVINEITYQGNILILPVVVGAWNIDSIENITEASLETLLNAEPLPELLLIGTGKQFRPPAPELRNALRMRGIAMDVMDTGAACRTYNVLLLEERRVLAALIAV